MGILFIGIIFSAGAVIGLCFYVFHVLNREAREEIEQEFYEINGYKPTSREIQQYYDDIQKGVKSV